ncbi:MAG: hypothetical protein FWB72_00080 [Firmicutes bacterium]|nr:hypothetical protein [Bacillota bacterium]
MGKKKRIKLEVPENKPESWASYVEMGNRALNMAPVSFVMGITALLLSIFFMPSDVFGEQALYFGFVFLSVIIGWFAFMFIRVQLKMNNTYKFKYLVLALIFGGFALSIASAVVFVVNSL